jgi:phospholipase/lecithinase/hemolysin
MFLPSTGHLQVPHHSFLIRVFQNLPRLLPARYPDRDESFLNWNTELGKAVHRFSAAHRDASVMIYSSWDIFTQVLDDPVRYGFSTEDVRKKGGAIWVDHLHPTSKMHDIIACGLARFLNAQAAYGVS